jgi:hypothetical protein
LVTERCWQCLRNSREGVVGEPAKPFIKSECWVGFVQRKAWSRGFNNYPLSPRVVLKPKALKNKANDEDHNKGQVKHFQ